VRTLGELELRLMDVLWDGEPLTVRQVQTKLHRPKPAYTTVMTTLDRLFRKGLLRREKDGLAFVYAAAMDRAEYHRRLVEASVAPLLEHGAGPVLAAFVDLAAGVSEENLERLEELIAARRRRR
jgi:predicted transcriptional regulator